MAYFTSIDLRIYGYQDDIDLFTVDNSTPEQHYDYWSSSIQREVDSFFCGGPETERPLQLGQLNGEAADL